MIIESNIGLTKDKFIKNVISFLRYEIKPKKYDDAKLDLFKNEYFNVFIL